MLKDKFIVDGFKLGYTIEGSGIPAIVIGSSIFYPRVFSQQLKKKLRFIFIDHRGFVKPPNREISLNEFSLDNLVDDIEAIRIHLKVEKILVIGHSGHAFLALEYAKKYPNNVLGVVMIGVSPNYSKEVHLQTEAFFEKTASIERKTQYNNSMSLLPGLIEVNTEKRFVNFCLCSGAKNWYQFDFDASLLWEGVYTNMQMIDYVWGEVFRDIDLKKNWSNFQGPICLLLGKNDYVTGPPELWLDFKNEFTNLEIKTFEESAHYPMFEEPKIFDTTLLNWIEEKLG